MRISLGSDLPHALTLHNVGQVDAIRRGLRLYRVPRAWRERFPEQTAWRAGQAAGVELRFRADVRHIALELDALAQIADSQLIALYHGARNVSLLSLLAVHSGTVTLLDVAEPVPNALSAPWRIVLPYGAEVTLQALHLSEGAALQPAPARPLRWLAHGDSITQGARALSPGLTYVHLAADALGWDALNLGFGGSAWGDAAVAEYIASRDDWDVLSIAIGTNTYGGSCESAADYRGRYRRFLEIVREAHPMKPILCITPIWRKQDGPPEQGNAYGDPPRAYREAIASAVQEAIAGDPQLGLLSGLELLGDDRGLSVDGVHPDGHGMIAMAQGIAAALQAMV